MREKIVIVSKGTGIINATLDAPIKCMERTTDHWVGHIAYVYNLITLKTAKQDQDLVSEN